MIDEDWEKLRKQITDRPPKDISQSLWEQNTHLIIDLLRGMIQTEPQRRMPADKLLNHPWFSIAGLRILERES